MRAHLESVYNRFMPVFNTFVRWPALLFPVFCMAGLTLMPVLVVLCAGGCDDGRAGAAEGYDHVYIVRGRVLKLPDGSIDDGFYAYHEPIPDYVSMNGKRGMPAMAMPFAVPDPTVLDGLAVGDVVEIEYGETFEPKVKQGVISITKLPADTVLSFDAESTPGAAELPEAFVDALTMPVEAVPSEVGRASEGIEHGGGPEAFRFHGPGTDGRARVVLVPAQGVEGWDISSYSYFRVELTNAGQGLVRVQGRLDNDGAQDWANSTSSEVFLMPGESATLGFAFPRNGGLDDSPPIFGQMSAKPNGFRGHWKSFNPSRVRRLNLRIESAHGPIDLRDVTLGLGYPYGKEANAEKLVTPYLDTFGQPIPYDWPGKAASLDALRAAWSADASGLEATAAIPGRSEYGGWAAGPQLDATGFFRVQKYDGKWWLVDPTGRLFWSHGMNSVNLRVSTPTRGREALFAALPTGDGLLANAGLYERRNFGPVVDFMSMNLARRYGTGWEAKARDTIHRRFAAWGMNTLGAWSDGVMQDEQRTPYTAIVHTWHPEREKIDDVADPFAEGFSRRLWEQIGNSAAGKREDPWCIGVFVDNELHWRGNLVDRVFQSRADQPAKVAFARHLQGQYDTIAALNTAWSSGFASWDALLTADGLGDASVPGEDREELYALYADHYYAQCRAALAQVMPNHLYLGSRMHSSPRVVAVSAAAHIDVFSVNHYWALAGTGVLPGGIDKPVMVTEYHFGTLDRGVLGPSLFPVHGQVQRGRAYAAYAASALIHDQIVGAHWFAYADQSAVGRPGENYQIGFVDITDRPYDDIVTSSRVIGERMYELRSDKDAELLGWLERHLPRAE